MNTRTKIWSVSETSGSRVAPGFSGKRNKNSRGNTGLLVFIVLVLLAGTLNYYLFRPGIILFRWLSPAHPPLEISNTALRLFFSGYFSDIAWCLALCATLLLFLRKGYLDSTAYLLILTTPFLIESAQYFKLAPGTFDWYDIAVYAAIEIAFYFRYLKRRL